MKKTARTAQLICVVWFVCLLAGLDYEVKVVVFQLCVYVCKHCILHRLFVCVFVLFVSANNLYQSNPVLAFVEKHFTHALLSTALTVYSCKFQMMYAFLSISNAYIM